MRSAIDWFFARLRRQQQPTMIAPLPAIPPPPASPRLTRVVETRVTDSGQPGGVVDVDVLFMVAAGKPYPEPMWLRFDDAEAQRLLEHLSLALEPSAP